MTMNASNVHARTGNSKVWGAAMSVLLLSSALPLSAHASPEAQPVAEASPGEAGAQQPEEPPSPKTSDSDSGVENARWRPGRGLEINSADGRFQLVTRLRGQFLYQAEDTFAGPGEREFTHAFLIRRARVSLSGFMFGEHNTFRMELAFSPRDLGFTDLSGDPNPPQTNRDNVPTLSPLRDLYMEFTYLRDLTLRVGQYKVPFNRQRIASSSELVLVDRSRVNNEFNVDRDLGVDVRSKDLFGLNLLRYYLGVYTGVGHSASALAAPSMMTLARVEVLPFGMFDDHKEGDLQRSQKPGLSIGAAYAHMEKARGTRGLLGRAPLDEGTTDYDVFTADAMFKWRGFSAQTEFHLRRGSRSPGNALDEDGLPIPPEDPREGYGWLFQASYLLPTTKLEVAARYGFIRGTGDETSLSDDNEAGLGLNYYFHQYAFKLQADYVRIWSDRFDEGDNQFRVQLQTSF